MLLLHVPHLRRYKTSTTDAGMERFVGMVSAGHPAIHWHGLHTINWAGLQP